MSAVLEPSTNLSALSLDEFIQQRGDLPTEELAKLRERLEIDRLQIDTALTYAEAEEAYDEDWYQKATYAYKAKGVTIRCIDNEISARRKQLEKLTPVTLADCFKQAAKNHLSPDSYNEIHRKAYARYHYELQRQAVLVFKLPAED
jgi:hypothetical protein